MTNLIEKSPIKFLGLSDPLLNEAFTHGSLDQGLSFERLEFLGDSIIEACVTLMLYRSFPQANEGKLSRWRSVLVNQQTLAEISSSMGLQENLKAHSEQLQALKKNPRIQASLFESLCGAISIEKGLPEAFSFIEEKLKPYFKDVDQLFKRSDSKTILQELSQKHFKLTPKYIKDESLGPSHTPTFRVSVWLENKKLSSAVGSSLKEAEQQTAKLAIENLKLEVES